MIQNSTALPGNTANNIDLLNSSQTTKVAQTPAQASQDETKLQNTNVSAAYAVEISAKGASLYSQSSSATASADLTQTTSTRVAASQNSTQAQTTETSANETDSFAAYSVEISQAGLNALESSATSDTDSTKPSSKPASKPASAPSTSNTATDTTDSSSSTADLSQYSDSQLQEMVSNGKISASDYNTEVAKRKSSEEVTVEKKPTPPPTEPMGTSDVSKSA